jgi:hypothetical protein
MPDYDRLSLTLSVFGLGSCVVHAAILPWAPTWSILLAPVHAACCGFLLLLLHPGIGAMLQRLQVLGDQADPLVILNDPIVKSAMSSSPPPPQPWRHTLFALVLRALADLFAAIHAARSRGGGAGAELTSAVLESLHEAAGAASIGCLLYASWHLGAQPSSFLSSMCWGLSICGGVQMLLSAPPPAALGTVALVCVGLAAARSLLACALVAQAASALCAALSASGKGTLPPPCADVPRWSAQTAGSLLLLSRPMLAALLPAGGGALAFAAERLGMSALTLSAYVAHFPLIPCDGEGDVDGEGGAHHGATGGGRGYESLEQMRAARRAAREAAQRAYVPPPPPLLQDSIGHRGGVQGLQWHDSSLCRDDDGATPRLAPTCPRRRSRARTRRSRRL